MECKKRNRKLSETSILFHKIDVIHLLFTIHHLLFANLARFNARSANFHSFNSAAKIHLN